MLLKKFLLDVPEGVVDRVLVPAPSELVLDDAADSHVRQRERLHDGALAAVTIRFREDLPIKIDDRTVRMDSATADVLHPLRTLIEGQLDIGLRATGFGEDLDPHIFTGHVDVVVPVHLPPQNDCARAGRFFD